MRAETGQRPSGLENCNPFAPPPIFCMMEGQLLAVTRLFLFFKVFSDLELGTEITIAGRK